MSDDEYKEKMLDRLGGYQVQQRILGNVDYRKARYVILSDFSVRQALFVDSKAEKSTSSATMQMSQLALSVRQVRGGTEIEQGGDLPPVSVHGGQHFITTTLLAHYHYEAPDNKYNLKQLTLAAVPNGILQDRYNPNAHDTIWIVGRNAPTRGEDFRVRLSFHRLKLKAAWRMQTINYDLTTRKILNGMIDTSMKYEPDNIYLGDAKTLAQHIDPNTIALSVWSPPYHVGKDYERDMSFFDWKNLLRRVIEAHASILKPGAFLAINIADILCFKDPDMPRIMAENVSRRKRSDITREMVLEVWAKHPNHNRRQIAAILGCSEQTVDRRLKGNNIRGGKYETQTRVHLVGGMLEQYALDCGLYLYDRRAWVKDAAWENSRWHTMSYRAVDEFEHIYIFWKPGATKVDKNRLTQDEWTAWGSRGVWYIPSVRANDDHEAKFPLELPRRIIQLLTEPDDLVLDCFVGSGTSATAAIREKRRFIGVDNSPASVDLASEALKLALEERKQEKLRLFNPTQIQKAS